MLDSIGKDFSKHLIQTTSSSLETLLKDWGIQRLYANDWPGWKCDGHKKPLQLDESLTPLHVAATHQGRLAVYKYILDITRDKNPISGEP